MENTMISRAVRFRTTNVKALKLAKARKPTAIGWMNLKTSVAMLLLSIYFKRKLKAPMRILAGKIHINRVKTANGNLPLL
jgi:hypothetical protein